jgi:hypothetical protein
MTILQAWWRTWPDNRTGYAVKYVNEKQEQASRSAFNVNVEGLWHWTRCQTRWRFWQKNVSEAYRLIGKGVTNNFRLELSVFLFFFFTFWHSSITQHHLCRVSQNSYILFYMRCQILLALSVAFNFWGVASCCVRYCGLFWACSQSQQCFLFHIPIHIACCGLYMPSSGGI